MRDVFISIKSALTAAVVLVSLAPSASLAQDNSSPLGIEAGVSTLGIYIGPNYNLGDRLTARLPIYLGSATFQNSFEGNDATVNASTTSAALLADYHPFGGAFRVSGGLGFGGYEVTSSIVNPNLDGTVFTGTADFNFEQKDNVVPVLSLGYAKTFKSGFGVVAELGAKFGTYTVASSSSFLPSGQQADYDAEIARINRQFANDIKATPFLTLGISYKY